MKTRFSFAVLLLIAIFIAGCQGQPLPANDPAAAVVTIAARQNEVNSYHLELSSKLTSESGGPPPTGPLASIWAAAIKNVSAGVTASGDVNSPKNEFAMQGGADLGSLTPLLAPGQDQINFEIVRVDGKQYTNLNHQGWNVADAPASRTVIGTPGNASDVGTTARDFLLATILRTVTTVEQLPDETLAGVDTLHYRLTVDPASVIDMTVNLLQRVTNGQYDAAALGQARAAVQNSKASLDIWVNKDTLYLEAFRFNIHYGAVVAPQQPATLTAFDFTLDGRLTKINEPVTITAPQ